METGIADIPAVLLFTDGAFAFAHRCLGFGWVAVDPADGREIKRTSGSVRNDGTASLAAEAASAALALEWAVENGFRRIWLHTDCHGLRRHVQVRPRPRLREARRLFAVWQEATKVAAIEIVQAHSWHRHLRTAHHLAQCGMMGSRAELARMGRRPQEFPPRFGRSIARTTERLLLADSRRPDRTKSWSTGQYPAPASGSEM